MGEMWNRVPLGVAALCFSIAACGGEGGSPYFGIDAGAPPPEGFGRSDASVGPPEMEVDIQFEPPAVGATVLYATNRAAGRVAVIHADDFSIETVRVGVDPAPAIAAPGRDVALSLQRGESTVSVLHTMGANTTVTTVPIEHDVNTAAFDPTGRYAVLYEAARPPEERRNFHDVSVLDLEDAETPVARFVVGYGPSHVAFDPAGARAFVVTEDGICTLDLARGAADPVRAPLLGFDTIFPIEEAHVSADGRYAVALVEGTQVRQLDLADGTLTSADLTVLSMDGEVTVTDLDLAPSGTEVLAVVRSHEVIARLPLGPTLSDPTAWITLSLVGHGVGSLAFSGTGDRVVGYTTDPSIESITVLDLALNEGRRILLRKSVRALRVSSDGAFALALHHAVTEEGTTEDALVDEAQGYSIIDLATGFSRLALAEAAPRPDGVVLDDASGHLLLALRDDATGVRELQLVDLASFAVDRVPLLAPPTTVGIFPALDRAFIGQEADGGRVTFYTWGSGETHTVAGFELAARIRR
ncbi:MAG: hypothetical protein H6719_20730 [Sandaracinaceae bacterium]|nr:hypothetical protein [Sandaracinaceae bacterium]